MSEEMATDRTKPAGSASAKSGAAKGAASKPVKGSGGRAPKPASPNMIGRMGKYFRDVRVEMNRVVWPTRDEVYQSSIVVVIALMFFIAYVSIWDLLASWVFITLPSGIFGR